MVARPPASRPGSIGRASPCLVCLDSVGVRLKLGVHSAEQSPDGRTHSLVAHVNDHRDCGEDQRVFRHRLTPRVLVSRHIQLSDQVHCRVLRPFTSSKEPTAKTNMFTRPLIPYSL